MHLKGNRMYRAEKKREAEMKSFVVQFELCIFFLENSNLYNKTDLSLLDE